MEKLKEKKSSEKVTHAHPATVSTKTCLSGGAGKDLQIMPFKRWREKDGKVAGIKDATDEPVNTRRVRLMGVAMPE